MWPLSKAWYGNRLAPNYRPATVDHLHGLLRAVVLTDRDRERTIAGVVQPDGVHGAGQALELA